MDAIDISGSLFMRFNPHSVNGSDTILTKCWSNKIKEKRKRIEKWIFNLVSS